MKTRYMAMALVAAPGLLLSAPVVAAPVDLNDWTAASYPAVSGFGAGVWTVAADGSSVTQSVNGQPTLFFGDFNAFGTKVSGTIRVVSSGGDNDYIGFVLGFLPGDTGSSAADYLLIDWKQGTQSFNFGTPSLTPGGTAYEGLAVSRVTGVPTADEFWQHVDYDSDTGGGVEELQRAATLGSDGWAVGRDYAFTFDFGPNNLQVFVDGVKELDITGSFSNGRMGFYNFSQANVRYSAFDVDPGSFPPAVPEPASWAMLIGGFGLVGAQLRRRAHRVAFC